MEIAEVPGVSQRAFTRWTAPRLIEYLYGEAGERVTPEWLTEMLPTHGLA